ncbi:MAG: SLC13 family permease [Prevotella sp.]|nr:SLC13 family permease [Staphylococcus sp.]MCM1351080.1 SLC13 family permease [Prevotella sp.]
MSLSLILAIITIICLVLFILIKPSIQIGKIKLQSFWLVALIGAINIMLFTPISLDTLQKMVTENKGMNPLEILTLFISMSILSIALDEAGFFQMCAYMATKKVKKSQFALFISISIVVSILTIFTSNDIIILTFTPFICYFAKHTKINPIPYLVAEFVFANTWSMLFVIGNPTNIFLASSSHISFIDYFQIMALPTLVGGVVATILLLLLFHRSLQQPFSCPSEVEHQKLNPFVIMVCLFHLFVCTILLIISAYIDIEMWIIAVISAISLTIIMSVICIIKKEKWIIKVYKRAPWSLIPFVLSMYVVVLALDKGGMIQCIVSILDSICQTKESTIYAYGFTSYLFCNVLNNIPMSVLFENIISSSNSIFLTESMYSTIISSNIGAYFTPLGALAGIMWMSILRNAQIKFGFLQFIKYGALISFTVLIVALSALVWVV